jgi:hypothetical protein
VCPEPDQLVAKDEQATLLLHRQQVEVLNAAIRGKVRDRPTCTLANVVNKQRI